MQTLQGTPQHLLPLSLNAVKIRVRNPRYRSSAPADTQSLRLLQERTTRRGKFPIRARYLPSPPLPGLSGFPLQLERRRTRSEASLRSAAGTAPATPAAAPQRRRRSGRRTAGVPAASERPRAEGAAHPPAPTRVLFARAPRAASHRSSATAAERRSRGSPRPPPLPKNCSQFISRSATGSRRSSTSYRFSISLTRRSPLARSCSTRLLAAGTDAASDAARAQSSARPPARGLPSRSKSFRKALSFLPRAPVAAAAFLRAGAMRAEERRERTEPRSRTARQHRPPAPRSTAAQRAPAAQSELRERRRSQWERGAA